MKKYNGPERRSKSDFEREVIEFMARIEQHMSDQRGRCDSHSKNIEAVEERTSSLESSRNYAKGVLKAVGVGVPAIGSITWFLFEMGKFIKELKH